MSMKRSTLLWLSVGMLPLATAISLWKGSGVDGYYYNDILLLVALLAVGSFLDDTRKRVATLERRADDGGPSLRIEVVDAAGNVLWSQPIVDGHVLKPPQPPPGGTMQVVGGGGGGGGSGRGD